MIVVCGEALIDVIHNGDGTQRMVPGGGPFNTARALARLGVPTAFLGHLSNDAFGRELADLLVSDGASLELSSVGSESTTIAVAEVDNSGLAEYEFLVDGTSAPNLTLDMVPKRLSPDVRAIHLGTLGLVLQPTIGAGDAFGAALLAWLHDHDAIQPDIHLEKEEVKAALEFACLAAALTCARAGADPPWKSEMKAWESR